MSKPPVTETAASASAAEQETPLQCILYYSNPNFINDQDSATIQFGNDEDDDEEEEDDDEEEEEEEEEDEDEDDNQDAVKTQGFDLQPPRHLRHHCQHHQQQQQQQQMAGFQGVDDVQGSLEDQELDADASSYADYFEQDTSESRTVDSSIRSRQRQFSQQRLVTGSGGLGGPRGGPGPSLACICRATVACLRTKPCLFFIYVLVVLILLSSFVSIVLVAVLVVEPFARVSGFVNGSCRTLEVSVGREEQSCSCGKGCNSKYFCLKIQVEYYDQQAYAMLTATLYEDETSLNRQCSFYPPCRSSRQENEEAVHIYERLYGRPGLEFSCWYNPKDNRSSPSHVRRTTAAAFAKASGGGEVIQSKRFQAHHVAHGLVWSTLLFFGSFSFLFYMFRRKGCFH